MAQDPEIENIEIEYLPFEDPEEIPVEKQIKLAGTDYLVSISYNSENDFYTIIIKDLDSNLLHSQKLVYLVDAVNTPLNSLADIHIIPIDFADLEAEIPSHNHIGKENFDKIKLMLL